MNALLLVDIQNDFVPGGALAVPEGDQVVPVANRLMDAFKLVAATQDWHPPDHGSFASQHTGRRIGDVVELNGIEQILWPDHCIQDSPGADFAAGLDTGRIDRVIQKGTDPGIDSYSGFFDNGRRRATALNDVLRSAGVTRVYLMGLATDYCVKFTALDARKQGFETYLVEEGVRGVELAPGDCAQAIDMMHAAGVRVVRSDEV